MIIFKKNLKTLLTIVILLTLSINLNFVYAAASGSSGSSSSGSDGKENLYKSGKKLVYRAKKLEKKNKVEKAKKLYLKAYKKFEKAYSKDKKNADILNYLGYTLRKNGKFKEAEIYYLKRLELDAGHIGINEYLGELYVETNRIDLAKKRLDVLKGCNCEEYEELKEIIENQ